MFSPTLGTAFPFYLLPSIPFRRRSSASTTATTSRSTSSSSSSSSSPSTSPPTSYLTGSRSHLRCNRCLTDLCHTTQIISKGFTGRHGRAYLVSPHPLPFPASSTTGPAAAHTNLPNTHLHKAVPRMLVTGAHTVSDVSCALCGSVLGWKYVAAEEEAQRYKVGKFILETKRVCRGVCWENDGEDGVAAGFVGDVEGGDAEEIEFDSQDEDECEDLFAGVWTQELARKRRKGRAWRDGGALAEDV
ncbi:yippee-domain-containing protein [Saccharata proteae CBS 121410]|uniref:Yippee-domain-containing protein n=1 Tax=Saccharata proteae CBS 121410 TaxID=1314787 RepID=A0A9P4HN63_9PEZI|nr:yippee-domain-containing protein [Saccharata proteae CBS 121410]